MMRQAPAIKHVVQATALDREVRDAAALSSHRPNLMACLYVQNIFFPRSETHQRQRSQNDNYLTCLSLTTSAGASRALLRIFRIDDERSYKETIYHPILGEKGCAIAKYRELCWLHIGAICRETASKGFIKKRSNQC